MPTANNDGTALYYETDGEGEADGESEADG